MKYIRIEKNKVTYIDGRSTVHSTKYRPTNEKGTPPIVYIHIAENVRRLGWESYEVFHFRGDYWFWNGNAYASFCDAYETAAGRRTTKNFSLID